MIVGTAGHIDHGKTSLVKALTGVDADRLKEEKERGITLDLGYAYTPLPNGDILGFIDVPGHEKLVHNMLAGATGIDCLLLIIAADDGVMPQTIEHLHIVDLLGMRRGVVALTKIDTVSPPRAAEVEAQAAALMAGTGLAGSPIFPLSSITGQGVAELRRHLETTAETLPQRPLQGGFRLAVDRSFTLNGVGTVVTGTVFSGVVNVGDQLRILPSGLEVRIRGIHAQNQPSQGGKAGQRCALNLAGVDRQQIQRGDWVLAPFLQTPTSRVDVRMRLVADAPPLKHWSPVHVHLGTAHTTGHIALLEQESLPPGGEALAQLVLDRVVGAALGDRFVMRDASAQHTLGGGSVLDTRPPARGRRTPQRLAMLRAWEQGTTTEILAALLDCTTNGIDLAAFAANANLAEQDLVPLTESLPCVVARTRSPATAFSPVRWQALCELALEALTKAHAASTDTLGLNAEQLRMATAPQITRAAFAALIDHLLQDGRLAKDGSWLHLPGHQVTLGKTEEKLWREIEPMLASSPFQPPRVRDIGQAVDVDEAEIRMLMRRLARMGKTYLVAHDHYFLPAAVTELAGIVCQTAADHPEREVYASEFRTRIDTGRKLAIHILEFFDRVGFTRRVRDAHRIRNDSLLF
ncbi:selenocysteine-specific elongation factor [mine drainage metagenome]|uniref:Selenocysteine-specific elongation factor n=1 Tax=mine drainage metagenome TaxID=410659 RepID=A0A1J5RJH3_9ZZZZ